MFSLTALSPDRNLVRLLITLLGILKIIEHYVIEIMSVNTLTTDRKRFSRVKS